MMMKLFALARPIYPSTILLYLLIGESFMLQFRLCRDRSSFYRLPNVFTLASNYLLELDNTVGWGVLDNTDELVMLLGAAALSCGNGVVLAFEDIFGWGVWDSNDDELILLDVTGIWVVLEIIVR
jgi:hypothetical protein